MEFLIFISDSESCQGLRLPGLCLLFKLRVKGSKTRLEFAILLASKDAGTDNYVLELQFMTRRSLYGTGLVY